MQGLAKEKRLSIERTEVLQVGTPEKEFEAEEKVQRHCAGRNHGSLEKQHRAPVEAQEEVSVEIRLRMG
jgi:hypothetical protein